jgi:hypothetical protein
MKITLSPTMPTMAKAPLPPAPVLTIDDSPYVFGSPLLHFPHSTLSSMDGGQCKAIRRQRKQQEEGGRCHNEKRGTKDTMRGNLAADNTMRRGG